MDSDNAIFTILMLFFIILAIFGISLLIKSSDLTKCKVDVNNINECEVCTETKPLSVNIYKDTECIYNDLTGDVWCIK